MDRATEPRPQPVGAIHESPAHARSFRIVSGPFVNGPYGAGSQSDGEKQMEPHDG